MALVANLVTDCAKSRLYSLRFYMTPRHRRFKIKCPCPENISEKKIKIIDPVLVGNNFRNPIENSVLQQMNLQLLRRLR